MADSTYRSWLQNLANQGNQVADSLLQVVGDDGRVNDTWASNSGNFLGMGDPNNGGYRFSRDEVQNNNQEMWDAYTGGPARVTGGNGGITTGSGGGSSYDPADLAYLDDQKSLYERLLQSADSTLGSGLNSILDQYNQSKNKANTQFGRAETDYNQKEYETNYGKQQSINKVNANSRTLANSVRRLLGLAGASGGSAMDDANTAIAREASQNRTGVLGDYATNMGQLKTGRDRTKEDYDALLGELEAQKRGSEESLRAGVESQKQSIWNTLADITGKRASLMGGNYQAVRAAQDPYRQSYLNAQNTIDQLPNQFRNAVTARDVSVAPVSLKDYFVNKANVSANRGGQEAYSPYSQFLNKKRQEEA
jgi:hypothetical protein